jgi:hypothetical protein
MANFTDIKGLTAYDRDNNKVGTIQDLYYDDDANEPTWVTVKTGLFGNKVNFVPLKDAKHNDDGVQLAVSEEQVKDAPGIEADEELPEEDEQRLYEHYGFMDNDEGRDDSERSADAGHDEADQDHANTTGVGSTGGVGNAGAAGAAGVAGAAGAATGTATGNRDGQTATQGHDQANVHGGRMRLRKYIVTENVQVTVPVQREVVELEPEDGTPNNQNPTDPNVQR